MLLAHDLGMTTGEYQFLYVRPYISDEDEVDKMTSQQFWKQYDGRDEDAQMAYRSLLVVSGVFHNNHNVHTHTHTHTHTHLSLIHI